MLNTRPTLEEPISAQELREQARLAALDRLDILDTPSEESFERIVRLIRNIFNVPIALVSLMAGHRQWHKARFGIDAHGEERKLTFCQIPVASGTPLIVKDARLDARVASNPYVTGAPGIRFYAGVPLITRDGHAVGTVCAIDTAARDFSARDLQILTDLGQMAMRELELHAGISPNGPAGPVAGPPSAVQPLPTCSTERSRRRVLKAGRIYFNNRYSTIDCTLRSLGEDGAGIEVWNAFEVPDTFLLVILAEVKEMSCRVTSRTAKHVEVEFR